MANDFANSLVIDGQLARPKQLNTFVNVDPFTEEPLGPTADATFEDVDLAISAARRAFDAERWSNDPLLRARTLTQLQEALRQHEEELREILISEVGCPRFMTDAMQLHTPIEAILSDSIERATSFQYEYELPPNPNGEVDSRRVVMREPRGVVAAITPFNYPIQQFFHKAAPALAAGNTIVLKPSPLTPWTSLLIGKISIEETDIPAGVINIITTSSSGVSEQLVADPRVDMVTFTGSSATGKRVFEVAAGALKKVVMELGGKSANIVLDDADIAAAVRTNVFRMSRHSGQGCTNLTRLLLPRSRYEEGLEVAADSAAEVPYGDPRDPKTHMGPLISAQQRDRVENYIAAGLAEGGRLIAGGHRPQDCPRGYFVEATVIADVRPDATLAQEEIFGPVLAVIPYDSDDEAVDIANNSRYGLSGKVTSGSTTRALEIARRLRTGTIDINDGSWGGGDAMFGGMKESGMGYESGPVGFGEFLSYRIIGFPDE